MAVFLGCLQYALEEGPRWDWLDEKTIRAAVIVSAVTGSLFFWRVLSYRQPIVDLRTFGNRIFALLLLHVPDGHRHVRHHLSGAAVSRPGARFQRLADRRNRRRRRAGAAGDVTVCPADRPASRSARHAGDWRRRVCRVDVPDGGADQSNRLLGVVRAAVGARYGPDVLLHVGQHDRTGHAGAGQDEERRRALQSDARSRRRDRSGVDRHDHERQAAFPLEPADRGHQPGARGGAAVSRGADGPVRRGGRGRPASGRAQAARQSDAARGAGLDIQRPVAAAWGTIRLWADTAAAGPPTVFVFRALTFPGSTAPDGPEWLGRR